MTITRPTHLLRRAVGLAAVPALLLTAAACGDDDESGDGGGGESASFCDEARDLEGSLDELDPTDADAMNDLISTIRDIEPPAEIADDWDTLINAFEQLADMSPEEIANVDSQQFTEADEASNRIGTYLQEECGEE